MSPESQHNTDAAQSASSHEPPGFWGGLISLAVMVFVLVIALMGANWLPGTLEKGLISQYPDIESARRALGFQKLYVPSYFPESVSWPASRILAQSTPHQAFTAEFKSAATGAPLLVVSQSEKPIPSAFDSLRMRHAIESSHLDIRGRRAEIVTGICASQEPCSMLSWQEGEYHLRLLMLGQPFTLLHMAESMIGEDSIGTQNLPQSPKTAVSPQPAVK